MRTTTENKPDLETITILILSPDDVITSAKQNDIIREPRRNIVRISALHWTNTPKWPRLHDKWIQTHHIRWQIKNAQHAPQQGLYNGGVAALIHVDIQHRIRQIIRVDRRVVGIILWGSRNAIISLIITYAPRKGYTREIRTQNWELAAKTLETAPGNQVRTWREDGNGQIGNRNRGAREILGILGANTNLARTEKRNGEELQNICVQHDMIPMETQRRNPGQGTHGAEETIACISPDGETHRKLDHVLINRTVP